ncbi:MAG: hypothetical protein GAK35_02646 [Herbaspirillum frisingense]|uniref:Uncharacterized protein n=1 Tax=Herbaspirillum frisingense TaxID=92645 RepID=A0A7V8FW27_9BURK|nr:MAG: hypothetical protein GAK35_02646 [Herbaspirillum frisingense]
MGWSIGYDKKRGRDIGYGVPAYCDHPGCKTEIDRGLGYVCGGEPFGGEHGCGLFICGEHTHASEECLQLCQHCAGKRADELTPSPDHPDWMEWKLTDESWQPWRDENPDEVTKIRVAISSAKERDC